MKSMLALLTSQRVKSPPARGAWIEMPYRSADFSSIPCRPPHGGRGLKCSGRGGIFQRRMSPPARGAWIEISRSLCEPASPASRPPHGGRGLKCSISSAISGSYASRPPHGGRGLKFRRRRSRVYSQRSPPARGAWIEITVAGVPASRVVASPPARGAWIEINSKENFRGGGRRRPPHGGRGLKFVLLEIGQVFAVSPPARGAWIEMPPSPQQVRDRCGSPPARGAWIEIATRSCSTVSAFASPPARGAWIEINFTSRPLTSTIVAPRTGGVD